MECDALLQLPRLRNAVEHGVSLDRVLAASSYIVAAVGHPLTSKVYQAGGRLRTIPAPR